MKRQLLLFNLIILVSCFTAVGAPYTENQVVNFDLSMEKNNQVVTILKQDISDYNYTWIWEEYSDAPRAIQDEDIVFWGENFGPYHNYNETTNKLLNLEKNFGSLVDVFSIGQSVRGRELWTVKITDESIHTPKTEFYIVAAHHAREAITVENSLYFIDKLVYDFINGNETIKEILQTTEIYVIPLLNPDGHSIVYWYPWQRKNMAAIDEDGDGTLIDEYEIKVVWDEETNRSVTIKEDLDEDGKVGEDYPGGVDLNRNYDFQWLGIGSSSNPRDDIYRGPEPGSEPEVQALCQFVNEHDFRVALSLHSGVQAIISPWGYTFDSPPHSEEFDLLESKLQALTGFPTWEEIGGYSVNGEWGDWMLGKKDILAFTIETYGDDYALNYWDFFNPPANKVINNSKIIYRAAIFLASNPHLTKSNSQPSISNLVLNRDENILHLTWESYDSDGDILSYSLYYGSNNRWKLIDSNIKGNSYSINLEQLDDGSYHFKLVANDGIDRVFVVTDEVVEVNYLTTASISYFFNSSINLLSFNVTDYDANENWNEKDILSVKINSTADPKGILLNITEQGKHSGVFTGSIYLIRNAETNSTHLNTFKKDTISISYTDKTTDDGTKDIVLNIEVTVKKVPFPFIAVISAFSLYATIKQRRKNR